MASEINKPFYRLDRYIYFLSDSLAQRADGHLRKSQIKVIQNTAGPAIQCSRNEIEKKLTSRLKEKRLDVTFLSNMIPSKGYMDLLQAIPYYKENCEETIAVNFIGNWPTKKSFKEFQYQVGQLNVDKNIVIWGGISDRKKLKKQLLNTDVFVLPTYYPLAAQPISIIEAMNAGTPIIATDHASISDYVIDNVNGYLIDKKSPKQIAQALLKLNKYEEWKEKALSSRTIYEQKFSPEITKQKLIDHFSTN